MTSLPRARWLNQNLRPGHPKQHQRHRGGGESELVQYPNDKSQQGVSSAADSVKLSPCLCTVRGFPPNARVLGDGSLSYSIMDDNGGTWDFLGSKDEVLVEWHIFDGAKDCYHTGNASYTPHTFEEIIRDLVTQLHLLHG